MPLTPEQKQTVGTWVAAGDNLSAIQKKLNEQFKVSMTYMDVRFLVDDLNLELKDPAPRVSADLSKAAPAQPKAPSAPAPHSASADQWDDAQDEGGLPPDSFGEDDAPAAGDETEAADAAPAPAGNVVVSVDKINLIPGALASGTVTFSDGVTGKWIVDNYGRPGFTEISQPGYRPSAADAQAFMQQLSGALSQQGF